MANHNYSQYSNNKKNATKADDKTEGVAKAETKVATPIEPIVETKTPEVKMEVETVETKELPKTATGTVANCSKLNIRVKPALTADVVCVLDVGATVTVNLAKSNRDWVSVTTGAGDKGYCMKKYVNVKL